MIKILRSLFAMLVGFVTYIGLAVLVDLLLRAYFPERFPRISETQAQDDVMLVIELFSQVTSGFLGCFLAARLAPAKPMGHALVVGSVCFILSVLAALQVCLLYPWWYLGLGLLSIFPTTWAGGNLCRRHLAKRKEGTPNKPPEPMSGLAPGHGTS